MIKREFDPAKINALVNEVDPTGGDVTALMENENNICLMAEGGGAFFAWRGPRIFEGHTFFRARGREAIDLGRAMLEKMSVEADLIWGATPIEYRNVRWFNRKIGFASLGTIELPAGQHELFEKRF